MGQAAPCMDSIADFVAKAKALAKCLYVLCNVCIYNYIYIYIYIYSILHVHITSYKHNGLKLKWQSDNALQDAAKHAMA